MSTSAQDLILDAFMAVADSNTLRAALHELAYRYAHEIERNETPDVKEDSVYGPPPAEPYPSEWPEEQMATKDIYRIEFWDDESLVWKKSHADSRPYVEAVDHAQVLSNSNGLEYRVMREVEV